MDVGINLSSGGTNPTFFKNGLGTMRLTSLGNTANINVFQGTLRVDDVATGGVGALGTGTIILNGGTLVYGGPSAMTTKNLTFSADGEIRVLTPGVNLNYNGVMTETASNRGLVVLGPVAGSPPSTLTLDAINTYASGTAVRENAILAIPTIANTGVASPIGSDPIDRGIYLGTTGSRGALVLTGINPAFSTNRSVFISGNYGDQAGGEVGVQNEATNLTIAGKITGLGSLIKTGAGTLTLTNTTNSYTGGTYVEAGTLNVGAIGAVIPANSNLTVSPGATFQVSFTGDNSAAPLGTLTLDGGTMRIPAGNPVQYSVNRLVTTTGGGTVDVAFGSLNFKGAGPRATINGNTIWTSTDAGGAGKIYVAGDTEVNLDIASNVTLTNGLFMTGNFRITGGGTLYMNRTPTNRPAHFTVTQGRLRVDDISVTDFGNSVLGSVDNPPVLTLDGGALQYTGPTNSTRMPFALTSAGGTVEVSNAFTTLALTGPITASGQLNKTGPGVLILNNFANQYAGGIAVSGGRIDVSNDAQLGVAAVTVNPFGVLRYTATTTTAARNFTLNSGTLEAAAGVTLVMNGASVGGGFLRGTGTIELAGGTSLSGVTTQASTTIVQTGPASVANFTNGGSFTVGAGQTLAWNSGTNNASGRIVVEGTANVNDPMELNGGVLVNNGTVTGTVNVNAGAGAMGSGSFGRVNVNRGGVYAPGNSPGISTAASVLFDNSPAIVAGPTLAIELAGITPGTGFDQLHVTGQLSLGGTLAVSLIEGFTPTAGNSFDILDWGTLSGTFSTIDLPTLAGLAWNISQLYTTGVLSVAAAGLPGNYNQNGTVDAADYVVWRKGLGTTYTQNDYTIWRANFGLTAGTGRGPPAGAANSSDATVPEPATWALLLGTLCLFVLGSEAKPHQSSRRGNCTMRFSLARARIGQSRPHNRWQRMVPCAACF